MRISHTVMPPVMIAVSTLTVVSVAGCSSHSKSSTPTSGSAASPTAHAPLSDYTTLLIKASDINAPNRSRPAQPVKNPNGQQGATTTFSDQDHSHAIIDTILVPLDPAAAANALDSAKGNAARDAARQNRMSADVGVDGTTITGTSPDRSKGVTVLLFTEGKAFVSWNSTAPPTRWHRRNSSSTSATNKTPPSKRASVASAIRRFQCPGSNARGSAVGPVIPVSWLQWASPPERGLGMRRVMMRSASTSSSRARCEPRQ